MGRPCFVFPLRAGLMFGLVIQGRGFVIRGLGFVIHAIAVGE